jgi:CheY-like chemotaxis protein
MSEQLLFFIIDGSKVMQRIIADFIRQMVRRVEIPGEVEFYEASSGERALELFEIMFKNTARTPATYRDEPIMPLPGGQGKAVVICDIEMEPIGGRELLRICSADQVLRDMNFVMMTQNPDLGLISELGELGVMNVLA